jgi:hypothetical protein
MTKRVFEKISPVKVSPVMLSTQRSLLAPLKKGGTALKSPFFRGIQGDLARFATNSRTFQISSKSSITKLDGAGSLNPGY